MDSSLKNAFASWPLWGRILLAAIVALTVVRVVLIVAYGYGDSDTPAEFVTSLSNLIGLNT